MTSTQANFPIKRVCELLGCSVPVVLAGMGGVSRSELVAAVAAAGGFGFLGMVREPPELIVREVERLRRLGHRHFGVNLIPAATDPQLLEHQVVTCIQLAVPVVGTFWDLNERVTARLRDAGIIVVHQVGSVDEAIAAERAGVEVIIAQGREAGGHVRGIRPLRELLPEVAGNERSPVLAAGGLATGGDLVTAMALGAAGIVLGTAMIATDESFAHQHHKQRLLAATAGDTVLTSSFHINWPPGAPVRVLKSAVTSLACSGTDPNGKTVIGAEDGRPIYLFSTDLPLRSMTGDFESMALYAGTGVGRIAEITGAGDRLRALVAEAEDLLRIEPDTAPETEFSSPVCYAHEMTGAYMGFLSEEEIAADLWMLADDMQIALRAHLSQQSDEAAPSQPPFADTAVEFAAWALRLQQLAAIVGRGRFRTSTDIALARLVGLDVARIQASIVRRLGAIVARVAEPDVGEPLRRLLAFMQRQGLNTIRAAATRSPENHGASGR